MAFNCKSSARIAIVGVGQVGGAAAYALVLGSLACELLLVDNNIELCEGQVRDLSDAAYTTNSSTRVRAANYHEAGQCDIIVITAGSRRTVGQSGLDAASRNTSIVRTVVNAMAPIRSDAILLVVSHPVDLLTTLAQELSRLPPAQVFGVGTFLDSSRLRGLLSDRVGIAAKSMDVYVVGVHGESSQVTAWSTASVGGVHLDKSLSDSILLPTRAEVEQESQQRAQAVVRAKGSMPFGMGAAVASICASIVLDKRNVRSVSHYQPEFGCYFSLPAVLGRSGIVKSMVVPLSAEEGARVTDAAAQVRNQMDKLRKTL